MYCIIYRYIGVPPSLDPPGFIAEETQESATEGSHVAQETSVAEENGTDQEYTEAGNQNAEVSCN